MKEEQIQDEVDLLRDDWVKGDIKNDKKNKKRRKIIYIIVAAVLVITLVSGIIYRATHPTVDMYADKIYAAEYPGLDSDGRQKNYDELKDEYSKNSVDISEFTEKTIGQFLQDSEGENIIYSPISAYLALGMLAEVTGGESRSQILELLGNDSIDKLRENAGLLWNLHYIDTETTKNLLANSVWIDEGRDFKKNALKNIKENYYASSFEVDMSSDDCNKALNAWINENTGDVLKEQVDDQKVMANTFMVLLNTVFYKAEWETKFDKEKNIDGEFCGANGDEDCQFMKQRDTMSYIDNDIFRAVEKPFKENGGSMYFILPEDELTIDELLSKEETIEFIANPDAYTDRSDEIVNLRVPKFDIEHQMELDDGLRKLGMSDVFAASTADFSPLIGTKSGPEYVGSILQGAGVSVGEEGCIAEAYTKIQFTVKGVDMDDEISFYLNRPFVFVITSEVGIPLFVGVVNSVE